jgi:hypothetical protein
MACAGQSSQRLDDEKCVQRVLRRLEDTAPTDQETRCDRGLWAKGIKTRRVERFEDAVKSSGRLGDKLKNRYGREPSTYVKLQSIRIKGGDIP